MTRASRLAKRLGTLTVVLAGVVVLGRLAMPYAGRSLIQVDPLARADAIVVLGSTRLERTLEAGVLFREGWAPRILLLRPPDIVRDSLRQQLGLRLPVFLDIQKDALAQMGVPKAAIVDSPRTQDSTHNEARAVAEYARQRGFRRIIIVTSPYHTRRAGSWFRLEVEPSLQVIMRADRYEPADPDGWWRHAPDRTDVVLEYLKTLHGLVVR